jgi:hypothetical protein
MRKKQRHGGLSPYHVRLIRKYLKTLIREERDTPKPGREWFWSLTITGAYRAGVLTWGYGANLEEAKAAFRTSLEGYRAWMARDSDSDQG